MPDLAQEIHVRADSQYTPAHLPQKMVGNLVPDVKANAVHSILPDPTFAQSAEILNYFRMIGVQLRHLIGEGKGIIPAVAGIPSFLRERPAVDQKPLPVGRRRPFLEHVPPGREQGPAMVEHRVHHHADPGIVRLLHQRGKLLVGAEVRIHPLIAFRIVFVYRARREDRSQVQPVHAEIPQIPEFFPDPGQIAAEAFPVCHRAGAPRRFPRLRSGAAEAIGKNLIPDRIAHPLRRRGDIRGIHPRLVKRGRSAVPLLLLGRAEAVLSEQPRFAVLVKLKMIPAPLVRRANHRRPPAHMPQPQRARQLHPFAVPPLGSAEDSGLKRIAPMQKDLLHIRVGLQPDHQLILVPGIAVGSLRPMENRREIHRFLSFFPDSRVCGRSSASYTRSSSPTLHACAKQPREAVGFSPS